MFSVSDIKETVYPAAYRRGKELYETAGVFDFSYELYLVDELPVADVRAKVRGINQEYYEVTATIDEEFGDVTNCNCGCEAFYNYEGMCKHCVAMLLNYVNKRTPMGDSQVKTGTGHGDTGSRGMSGGEDGDGSAVEKSAEPVFHACNIQIYVTGNHLRKSRVRTLL